MHVPKVFDRFEMKMMKDYHDLYLLVDVFEKFRNASLKKYGLCANHYLSSKTLSWVGILSMIKVKAELISDVDTYFFFEKGMKVGPCDISKRYSQASNNYLKVHEPKQSTIADFYKIPICTVKTLLPNVFDKEIMCFIMKTWGFFGGWN